MSPVLKLAADVLNGLNDAILHAPHTVPNASVGRHHVRSLQAIKKDVQLIVNLAGEAAGIEHDHGPDFKALLYELLDAVQLQGGRQGLATADRAGLDSALAAIREMGPLLGKRPDERADLLEAVRAQDATCTLHVFAANRSRFDGKPDEEHQDYPVPPGVSLCRGLVFLVPVAPPAADKRRAIVIEVLADGRGAIARVKLEDRFSRVAVPTEAAN